jgi:hypothetical protein
MTSHYRTLGVDPEADPVVIRSAYLALMRRYHPRGGGVEADPARAKAVTAAWEVLRDPTRRALLAAGTVGLGWWALGEQQLVPTPTKTASNAVQPTTSRKSSAWWWSHRRFPSARRPRVPTRSADAHMEQRRRAAPERPSAAAPRGDVRTAPAAPVPAQITARVDVAPLERHLQLLTDQSFRFGTEAKKARVMSSREAFLSRLRGCETDSCKRDAYLRRNAEIGEIMRN